MNPYRANRPLKDHAKVYRFATQDDLIHVRALYHKYNNRADSDNEGYTWKDANLFYYFPDK